ncbi:MAG: sarcosine oxidase subunit delta [Pseudomonadota bacterium]
MIHIPCPWCGPRDETEFTYGGEAGDVMPALDGQSDQVAWHAFVHLSENPSGPVSEFWYHGGGCGRWLLVRRDTASYEILEVRDAVEAARGPKDDVER